MLNAKQIVETAERVRAIPDLQYAAVSNFLYDAASDATEAALSLETEPDKREVLRGYAKGIRDALAHLHDLHGTGFREWPGVEDYLKAKAGAVDGDEE